MRLTDYRLIDQWNVDDEFDCLTPRLWHKSDIHTGITGNSCGMVLHSYWSPCAVVWMPKAALLLAKPNAKLGQGRVQRRNQPTSYSGARINKVSEQSL